MKAPQAWTHFLATLDSKKLRPLQLNHDSVSQWGRKDVVIMLLVARTPYALIYTRRESMMPEGDREEERYCIFTLLCRDL